MKHKGLTIHLILVLLLVLLLALEGTAGAQEPTPPEGCAQLTDPGAADLTDAEVAALKAACPEPEQQAQAAVASASVTPLSAGGPDAFGYTFIDSNESGGPTYNFEDISSTGTVLTLDDDQVSGAIGLGFTFNYYGVDYTQIYVSSNGFLTMQPTSSGCCSGRQLPSNDSVNGVIAGWWEDLDPWYFRPNLYYQTLGSTPNRRFIVQVNAVPHYPGWYGRYRATFQFKLFEGTNHIEVHYQAAPSDGGQHSAGIEDPSETIGLQYYLGRSGLVTPLAVLYTPNAPTADPGGPYVGVEGSPVAFDGSGSSDPNGDPLQYDWDFGDGTPIVINAGPTPSHTYGDNGTYTVCVTVTDPGGYSDTQCTNAGTTTGVPVSVTFETLATSCYTGGPLQLFLNGNLIGQANAPGNCTCTPGVGTVNISGDTIGPFYNVGADNTWAFSKGPGRPYTAWARATIDYGSLTEQVCLFDYGGGNCQDIDLCNAGYTDSAVNASSVVPFIPSTEVTIDNVAPTATFNEPGAVNEGSDINLSLTGPYDPSSADTTAGFEYAFDCGDGAGYGSFSSSNSAVCPTTDNGSRTVKGKIRDKDGGETEYTASVTVNNVPPDLGAISVDQTLVLVGTTINANANFSDDGSNDTHTAEWDWGDNTVEAGTVTQGAGSGSVADSHTYSAAGIYTIQLTVTDDDGGSGQSVFQYVVVYDPSAGFVTGGGWIDSPAGAYMPDPNLAGKANFGFVSKYKKGATTPTGNTEFQFHAASLNFHSDTYEWLVVTGSDYARFKGVGTINGMGDYKLMLWARDGEPDTFRIKIWEEDDVGNETVTYDNGFDQAIAGGSIVIHTKKK